MILTYLITINELNEKISSGCETVILSNLCPPTPVTAVDLSKVLTSEAMAPILAKPELQQKLIPVFIAEEGLVVDNISEFYYEFHPLQW